MNTKLINSLKSITREQCANHFDGDCIIRDKRCRYFEAADNLPRCRYLEESVLPYEPNNPVRVLYYASLDAERTGQDLSNKKASSIMQAASKQIECEKCGRPFKPSGNRQIYCDRCGKIIQKEKTRQRLQKLRENKRVV